LNAQPFSHFLTAEQEDLVRGLLAEGAVGRDALCRWTTLTDFEDVEQAVRRLLPLVSDRASSLDLDTKKRNVLMGMKRHAFAGNARLLHAVRPTLEALAEAGIPVSLLKGAALAYTNYASPALRPMMDVDLVIKPDRFLEACGVFRAQGWRVKGGFWPKTQLDIGTLDIVLFLHDAPPINVDLHFAFGYSASAPAQEMIWETVEQFPPGPKGICQPIASDHLVLVLHHGGRFNPIHPLRWIIDAAALIETSAIDWDRVVTLGGLFGIGPVVADQLSYLKAIRPKAVPQHVITTLSQLPISLEQRQLLVKSSKDPSLYTIHEQYLSYKVQFDIASAAFPRLSSVLFYGRVLMRLGHLKKWVRLLKLLTNTIGLRR
jgi:hypothetical protein